MSARGPRLRLVCVNDVYALDHLPRLRSLVRHFAARDPADVMLTTLAGDFVAPSLLSSLDRGEAMIDCLDAVPVTHVCFGNHEQDVPYAALQQRARQYKGTWLNTNMPGFTPTLPPSQVIELRGEGTRAVRVGLIGVVTEDPTLYPRGAFGGQRIAPANAAALAAARALVADGCACVIALTHQSLDRDRTLAKTQGDPPIPLILGGHEHDAHIEHVGSAWIVKTGVDAHYAAVIDLTWPAERGADSDAADLPTVSVHLEPTRDYPDDVELRARVDRHMAKVHALHTTTLLRLGPGEVLSSVGTRARQTSVGAMIASRVRDALGVDACVINGGGVRANTEHTGAFTYGDLEAELPFSNEVVVAEMPGRVLREAVAASRAHAPRPAPGFLQVDDKMGVTDAHQLIAVGGAPLDDERRYRVATVRVLFDGMDSIEPLVRFAREHPERVPPRDSGRELKLIVLQAFAMELWRTLGAFESIDVDRDARVTSDELRAAIARATREAPSVFMVDGIIDALDGDGDGVISLDESRRA